MGVHLGWSFKQSAEGHRADRTEEKTPKGRWGSSGSGEKGGTASALPPHRQASLLQSPCGEGWGVGFSQPSPRRALAWDSFPAGLIPLSESLQLTHNPVVTHWTMCSEQSSFQREKNSSGGVS